MASVTVVGRTFNFRLGWLKPLSLLLAGFQLGTSSLYSLGEIYAEIAALVGRANPFRLG